MKMNILVLVKESERYMFCYDDDSASECHRIFGQYAADESLSFTWFDAAVMSQKLRAQQFKNYQDKQKRDNQ